ncbi:Carboxymuconolactone decarboxylase [Hyphomicrobiales bacterium]|nr:Carboxymuconolactone decarboxylase [Hyphomicrobiales bacterium]CAH1691509.1 Carboxymuconolactone decarboxylase [Hyphomicrobiales bacterium]
MSELDAQRQALKDQIIAERGYWHPFHQGLLERDPDFLAAYLAFLSQPWRTGVLQPKVREFIYIAVDASVAHMYERGMRRHIEFALERGATPDEVLEVVELAAGLGGESAILGVRILAEELKAIRGEDVEAAALSEEQKRLKDEFIAVMGGWPDYGDAFLSLDADYLRSFLAFVGGPWKRGTLEPKIKDFVAIAVNSSPATLNPDGVRRHIRSALDHGATSTEIMEVIQLAAAIAIHTCTIGVPNLVEADAARTGIVG